VIKVNKKFVFYQIKATIQVLKSTEIINKNDMFSKNNTKVAEIEFKNFYSYLMVKLPKNRVSKMYIPKNRIIYQYMITTPNIVERYSPITIISKSGGIEISFQATTLESGKEGDFIKVKDKHNKIFKVKLNKNGNGIL
jgi:flagella basal body P-ring formation protein FlgA